MKNIVLSKWFPVESFFALRVLQMYVDDDSGEKFALVGLPEGGDTWFVPIPQKQYDILLGEMQGKEPPTSP